MLVTVLVTVTALVYASACLNTSSSFSHLVELLREALHDFLLARQRLRQHVARRIHTQDPEQ